MADMSTKRAFPYFLVIFLNNLSLPNIWEKYSVFHMNNL